MAYLSLYNRWRPQNFTAIVGQKAMKQALTNAIASGKIAHAYLFSGPRGTGKTSTARILAKALNCEQGPTSEPCGCCSNCERITAGTSMDVYELDAASNRGIDDIKNLLEQMAFAPVDGRYKIYIIDEVHMLTTEAFNALLKTLEEPPAHVIFILATTDPHKIPPTIHSRCQRFEFHRITVEDIAEHLAMVAEKSGIKAEADALRLIAIQAEGGMRDALSLLDQCSVMTEKVNVATVRQVLGIVGREALREMVQGIGEGKLSLVLEKLKELLEQGKDVKQILAELSEYLRALLLYKAAPDFDEVYLTDTQEALEKAAKLFGQERILACEERIHQAAQELKGAMRPRITVELCLFDLCRPEGNSIAALRARVESLEQKLAQGNITPAVAVQQQVIGQNNHLQQLEPEDDLAPVETAPAVSTVKTDFAVVQPVEVRPVAADKEKPVKKAPVTKPQVQEYGGDWATGEDYWKQALEILANEKKLSIASCAKNGRVVSFEQNKLTVAFKLPFMSERMNKQDYRKAIEEVILRIARRAVHLECIVEGAPRPAPKKAENVVSPKKQQPMAMPEQLQKVVNTLGGNVKNIENHKEE